jgi:hypothetical protein
MVLDLVDVDPRLPGQLWLGMQAGNPYVHAFTAEPAVVTWLTEARPGKDLYPRRAWRLADATLVEVTAVQAPATLADAP